MKVYVRHGDIFDPFNYEKTRDASSLGDAIVIELLNRFPGEVHQRMAGELPKACLEGLKELDNVRPLLAIPTWVDGLLHRTCKDETQIREVKKIWNDLADHFLNLDFVTERDKSFRFDLVDQLEAGLKLSQTFSFHNVTKLISFFNKAFGARGGDDFYRNALTEEAFKSQRAHYISVWPHASS